MNRLWPMTACWGERRRTMTFAWNYLPLWIFYLKNIFSCCWWWLANCRVKYDKRCIDSLFEIQLFPSCQMRWGLQPWRSYLLQDTSW
jgi:hypothetical protein